jgi:exopolysaccharide biosynthesis polyprenyl glycosylphosphotransferase
VQARQLAALRNLHLVLDALVVLASMVLTGALHGSMRTLDLVRGTPRFAEFASLVYLALPLWLILIVVLQLHLSFERLLGHGELLLKLIKLHAAGLVGLLLVQFVTQSVINRSLVILFLLCSFCLLYGERIVLRSWVRYQHRSGQNRMRILLVGRLSRRMGDFIRDAQRQALPPHILGYLRSPVVGEATSLPPDDMVPVECVGVISEIGRVLHEQAVDHVMFFPPSNRPEELHEVLAECEQLAISASFSVNLVQVARAAPRLSSVYDHPFVTFDVSPKRPESLALKYGFDPIAAGVLLLLLSPLLMVIALAILITTGRPIFFSQVRAGLHGRQFRMLKFRTMVVDAEARREALRDDNEMQGPVFKIKEDARITSLGRVLRRSSLDELPQLFNVLAGSMSLVGPRPLPVVEHDQIQGWQRRRLSMKPGITGLWQVSGRSQLDFQEWMLLDLKYVEEWSLVLDLLILLRTVPAVLAGRGAY